MRSADESADVKRGPSRVQRALFKFVSNRLALAQSSLAQYTAKGEGHGRRYWVATGLLCDQPIPTGNAYVSVSLPELSQSVFLTTYGGLKPVFEQLLCDINANSEVNDALAPGLVHRLGTHTLSRFGWAGLLFARASDFFERLPGSLNVGGDKFDFVLVLPISEVECQIGLSQGYSSLLAFFAEHNRGLLHGHDQLVGEPLASGADAQASKRRAYGKTTAPPHAHAQYQAGLEQVPQESVSNNESVRNNDSARNNESISNDGVAGVGVSHSARSRRAGGRKRIGLGLLDRHASVSLGRSDNTVTTTTTAHDTVGAESIATESIATDRSILDRKGAGGLAQDLLKRVSGLRTYRDNSAGADPAASPGQDALSAQQRTALECLDQRLRYRMLLKYSGVVCLGCAAFVGAMALGLLPGLFAAAGVGVLYAAYREFLLMRDR